MTKKEKILKLAELLRDLKNDRNLIVSSEYIKKSEKVYSLFFDVFVKPDLKGIQYPKILFDDWDRTQEIEETGEMTFGYVTRGGKCLVINSGILKYAESENYLPVVDEISLEADMANYLLKRAEKNEKEFFEYRNWLFIRALNSIAHEYRHIMQARYRQFLKHPEKHKKQLEMLEKLLGVNAEQIAAEKEGSLAEKRKGSIAGLEAAAELAYMMGIIDPDEYRRYVDLVQGDTIYLGYASEKDARRYAHKKMWELLRVLREEEKYYQLQSSGGSLKSREEVLKFASIKGFRIDLACEVEELVLDEFAVDDEEKEMAVIEKKILKQISPKKIVAFAGISLNEAKNKTAEKKELTNLLKKAFKCSYLQKFVKNPFVRERLAAGFSELGLEKLEQLFVDKKEEVSLNEKIDCDIIDR